MIKDTTLVVLAGGLATRMRPITEKIPKSLIEVNDIPFIEHQIKLFERQGIKNILLSVGYKGEMIQEHLEKIKTSCKISFIFDGDTLLGTGGAIKKALPLLPDEFLVIYGDSYLNTDFNPIIDSFNKRERPYNALMTVYKNKDLFDQSNVIFKRGKIEQYSKTEKTSSMEHIDWGLSLFHQSAFSGLKDDQAFDLSQIFINSLNKNQLLGYEVHQRFYEIGSHQGLDELSKILKTNNF